MSEKRVAFVTGCTEGGIGYHFCLKLLERGFIVYATARSLAAMEPLDHPSVRKLVLDVTSDEQVDNVVQNIINEQGKIDIMINNAGIPLAGPLADIPVADMQYLFEVNVIALHRVARAVIPHMAQRKQGLIMNVGSIVGEMPTPWMGAYEASKAAVKVMTEVLEMECRPLNIKVTLVAPASVSTKIYKTFKDFELPPNSLYKRFIENIRERVAHGNVQKTTMPANEFAEIIISKAVSPRPPTYILAGGNSWLFWSFLWLPRRVMLNLLWNRYSTPKTKAT